MAGVDYAALKKGGFMRQKQKGFFSLRIQVVGGNLTAEKTYRKAGRLLCYKLACGKPRYKEHGKIR